MFLSMRDRLVPSCVKWGNDLLLKSLKSDESETVTFALESVPAVAPLMQRAE